MHQRLKMDKKENVEQTFLQRKHEISANQKVSKSRTFGPIWAQFGPKISQKFD